MNTFRTIIACAPKRLGAALMMLAAAVIVPAALFAWGPTNRPTFTVDKPADHVAFNSIVDKKNNIDERNFVVIKDAANTSEGGWKDEIAVQPGKEYLVRMEVHNNAADNLKLVSKNTRVKANVPATTGKSVQIDGFVTTDNWGAKKGTAGKHGEVWDQVVLKSGNGQNFNLAYVANSAVMYNNHYGKSGVKLANSIVEKAGALVGYDKLDGKIPGCFQYKAYVTFKVKPQFAGTSDFTVKKEVRKNGDTDKTWKKSVAVKPGDTVNYRINYENTGTTLQNNVHVRDYLPAGMTYVAGSTKIANPTHPQYVATSDGITKGDGLNIGGYQAGSNAYLMFSAKVDGTDNLPCGPQTLKNVGRITADGNYKEDNATVTVTGKDCAPEKVKACNTKTGIVEDVDKGKENTPPHTTDLSKCDKPEPEPEMVKACNTKTGVIEDVEKGKENTAPYTTDFSKCDKPTPEPEMVEACNTKTRVIEDVTKGTENTPPHTTDLSKCTQTPPVKNVKVCDETKGKIITVPETEADKYGPRNSKKCQPATPTPTPTPKPTPKPEAPSELPTTGPVEVLQAVIGVGSLTAAGYYFVTSRRIF